MIPLRDDAPCFRTPFITYLLLALNVLVFLFEISLEPGTRMNFLFQFGVVPAQVTAPLRGALQASATTSLVPLATSMFLHASWLHLLSNMLALWIFGDNVEDYLGHFSFLLFYLASGVAASLIHVFFNLSSDVPSVGASGAIAGVMGAYFLLFPSSRVLTLVPFFFVFFTWLPAWLVLGYWFVVQFLSGAATSIAYSHQTAGGIAFWAHVGGFLAGVTLIKLFGRRPPRYRHQGW
ncbi:MAG TPA: rhomboid family intramembrane serine protease [Terriglobales bacterium]|nr:rhomboid family intramembrane serine protease [Terriglobales bacterium]